MNLGSRPYKAHYIGPYVEPWIPGHIPCSHICCLLLRCASCAHVSCITSLLGPTYLGSHLCFRSCVPASMYHVLANLLGSDLFLLFLPDQFSHACSVIAQLFIHDPLPILLKSLLLWFFIFLHCRF